VQNQVYQERVFEKLKDNPKFSEVITRLQLDPASNKLPMMSFILLPMQRVTRLPLLVSAIVNAADQVEGHQGEFYKSVKNTYEIISKLVKRCNEGARKMQQTEQLLEIASQLDYPSNIKTFGLISQSRFLVKKGEMGVCITTNDINPFKKSPKINKLSVFLFNDLLIFTKKKASLLDTTIKYEVVDWAKRSLLYLDDNAKTSENAIFLIVLENNNGKRVEVSLSGLENNELSRWTEALKPPATGNEEESIYEAWDCPQYSCIQPYSAQQMDELSLDVGDVMQVLKKTSDGWLHGERIRDGETGWFPARYCDEIEDEHVRTRNLRNLYAAGFHGNH